MSIVALWLPILVSAVLVFLASSLMHMVLPLHKADFRKLPAEAEVMDALRKFDIPPGDYMMPRPASVGEMKSEEHRAKLARGPVAVMTFYPAGKMGMGASLVQWFAYSLLVGVFAGYVAGRVLGPGTHYLGVFRIVGATAYMGYAMAMLQESIWYKRDWGTTLRYQFDGLVYGLLTAGAFGWLWPH